MARGSRTGNIRVTHEKKLKRTSTGRPRPSANRLGQAARPARRRGDREQEVVELNSKVSVREQERQSVKKLLACEKEVNEEFAKTA